MIRAVLFDLYGTLFIYGDMKSAWRDWVEDLHGGLLNLGIQISQEKLAQVCDGFFSGSPPQRDGYTIYEMRIALLAEQLGKTPDLQWCQLMAMHSLKRWQQYIVPDPDALHVITLLKTRGILLGVLSNFDHYPHVYEILKQAQMYFLMDAIVISGEVELKKPDPAIFNLALQQLGVEAQQCLFVGDHPEQDVEGAMGAGLSAVLLQRNGVVDRLQMNYWADLKNGLDQGAHKKGGQRVTSLLDILNLI